VHDPIAEPWGPATPIRRGKEWPERVDVRLAEGVTEDRVERWVQTASLLALGRRRHGTSRWPNRVNRGRLGPKDLFGWQANASPTA
jgi:hypothetical protein